MPQYFCYQCQRTVSLRDGDFVCAVCGGEFIEEVRMNLPGNNGGIVFGDLPEEPREGGNAEQQPQQNQNNQQPGEAERGLRANARLRAGGLNLEHWMRDLFAAAPNLAPGGGNGPVSVHVSISPQGMVIRNGGGAAGAAGGARAAGVQLNFPDNIMEQLVAGNLPDFLQQILETNGVPGNSTAGSRGFSEELIKKYLPMSKVTQRHVDNGAQCTTCFDTFKLDDDVGMLDCDHIFHRPCIEPWLKTKSSCPVCRQPVSMDTWKRKYDDQANLSQFNVLEDLD